MAILLTAAWTGEADRRFYAWILSRFRWQDKRFTFPDDQHSYFSLRSIVRTLGLRNSGRQVSLIKLPPKHRQNLALRIRTILGIETRKHARDGGLTIRAVTDAIIRMIGSGDLRYRDRAFEMAFSLLAAGTCVGPKQSYTSIPWEMFACVLCDEGTGEYDLAEWAFEIIRSAVKKLQKDLAAGVRTLIVGVAIWL